MTIAVSEKMKRFIDLSSDKARMFIEAGFLDRAIDIYSDLLALVPNDPDVAFTLARLYREAERSADALQLLRLITTAHPDHVNALYNLGDILSNRGNFAEAAACFKQVLELNEEHSAAHNHLGICLALLSQPDEAHNHLLEAIRLVPGYVAAHHNLGYLYSNFWRLTEAAEQFKKAIELSPDNPQEYNHLGGIYLLEGDIAGALFYYQQALQHDPLNRPAAGNILFALNSTDAYSDEFIWQAQQRVTELYPSPVNPAPATFKRHDRIRVGYLSPDFKAHSVGFFIEPVLRCHNRSNFEIFCYDNTTVTDDVTGRMMSTGVTWRRIIGLSEKEISTQIANDHIDILIDLAGHTNNNRLDVFALQPAPIQVTWLGYPNTTCLKQIAFRITDDIADPSGLSYHRYTEQLIRMPQSFLCYGPPLLSPDVAGLPDEPITFCCFNNLSKFSDKILDLWVQLLKAVPGSLLSLKNGPLGDPVVRNRLIERFTSRGVDPQRLILSGFTKDRGGHLQRYNSCHIALDTYPYCGTTTTCEALWMGVPVVTLAGNTHVSRVGKSILTNVGIPELIAENTAEYLRIAAALAHDCERLRVYRQTLREKFLRSPLTDAPGFTTDLEKVYRQLYNGEIR